PIDAVARRQRHVARDHALRVADVIHDAAVGHVYGYEAEEVAILLEQHGRSVYEAELGHLRERHVAALGQGHEHALELIRLLAQLAPVAHGDRVALAALDRLRRLLAADRRFDHVLDVAHTQAVARRG